jgi:GNAT superfamily N-acetyltransferase
MTVPAGSTAPYARIPIRAASRTASLPFGGDRRDDRRVTTVSDLEAAANLNCVGGYSKLAHHCAGGEVRQFGTAVAFVTGVPIPLFNGCLAFGSAAADAALAADWISGRSVPSLYWTTDDDDTSELAEVARGRGLRREPWALPGMVLSPVPEPPASPAHITVERVDRGSLGGWRGILAADGMPMALAERLFPPSFVDDPEVALFAAHLDGSPVGTSIAIRTGDVGGVYAVIVDPTARRRGVGTAAAWAAVNAGREWGCDVVTLQATEMGFPSYVRMGFDTVVRYTTFASPT